MGFERRPPKPTLHPKRVSGGIKLLYRPPGSLTGEGSLAKDAAAMKALGQSLGQSASAAPESIGASTPSRTASAPDSSGASPSSSAHTPASAASGWTWASARWMRLVEDHAHGDQLVEGLEYARLGQTRSLEIKAGLLSARVQGRLPTAYKTEIRLPTIAAEQWAKVVSAAVEQARISAALLSAELPANIEDLFAPLGLRLFPSDEHDLATSCNCAVFRGKDPLTGEALPGGPTRWCKHVCCVMYLAAERWALQPLSIFSLRGLSESDLLDQLRHQRALAGMARAGAEAAPVYMQHVPINPELSRPLEEVLARDGHAGFFTGAAGSGVRSEPRLAHDAGGAGGSGALDAIDLSIQPPEVSHPLLRRLGASPMKDAKFPLVGLLATCYDLVGQAAIRGEEPPTDASPTDGATDRDGSGE